MGLLGGVRVLIVEDDEDNRFLLQECLQVLGAAVEAVPTAGEAVGMLPVDPVDLGLEIIKALQSRPPRQATQPPQEPRTAAG